MKSSVPNPELWRAQERAVLLCLVLSVGVALPSIVVAVRSESVLLLSDVLDYVRAIVVSLLAWRILRAGRTAGAQGFDYGTGRLQTLGGVVGASLYVGLLLVLAVVSVQRCFHPVELDRTFTGVGALLQLVAFAVDGWLWLRIRRLARQEFSPVLEMQWQSARADALASLAVFASLGLTLILFQYSWATYLDPFFSLVYIGYAGVSFLPGLMDGIRELSDKSLQEDLQLRIDRRLAENFHGYSAFHGVRSRRSGGRVFIEVALSFPSGQSVEAALETVERLRRGMESDIPGSEVRVALLPEGN